MDHLAQDLTVALEESESCGAPIGYTAFGESGGAATSLGASALSSETNNDEESSQWGGGESGMRRRSRSAGNLHMYTTNSAENNNSEDSTSSNNSGGGCQPHSQSSDLLKNKSSFHQSDSDELLFSTAVAKVLNTKSSLLSRIRRHYPASFHHTAFLRGGPSRLFNRMHQSKTLGPPCATKSSRLGVAQRHHIFNRAGAAFNVSSSGAAAESDSVNEQHSSGTIGGEHGQGSRPLNARRKRKLKRMSVDEPPSYMLAAAAVALTGKRKRQQQQQRLLEACGSGGYFGGRHYSGVVQTLPHGRRIKPLHPSVVTKIERILQPPPLPTPEDSLAMETQSTMDECEFASESSISWSGGEGHEGDDELTDWAPPQPPLDSNTTSSSPALEMQQASALITVSDPRQMRAGCRRLGAERRGYSINTSANERVARFVQDSTKSELRLLGAEQEKLGQLAALYSLELWVDGPSSSLLRKTARTPSMQPTQRHHNALNAAHKRIRIQSGGGGADRDILP